MVVEVVNSLAEGRKEGILRYKKSGRYIHALLRKTFDAGLVYLIDERWRSRLSTFPRGSSCVYPHRSAVPLNGCPSFSLFSLNVRA